MTKKAPNKAAKRRDPKPYNRPRGSWSREARDLEEAFDKYMKYCEEYEADYPTQKGVVLKVNKKRVPHLGFFLSKFLKIGRATWKRWIAEDFMNAYIKGPANPAYDKKTEARAQALHNEATRINDAIEYMIEECMINGDGSAQGLMFHLRTGYNKNPNVLPEENNEISIRVNVVTNDSN